jgi:hypothetical protein
MSPDVAHCLCTLAPTCASGMILPVEPSLARLPRCTWGEGPTPAVSGGYCGRCLGHAGGLWMAGHRVRYWLASVDQTVRMSIAWLGLAAW